MCPDSSEHPVTSFTCIMTPAVISLFPAPPCFSLLSRLWVTSLRTLVAPRPSLPVPQLTSSQISPHFQAFRGMSLGVEEKCTLSFYINTGCLTDKVGGWGVGWGCFFFPNCKSNGEGPRRGGGLHSAESFRELSQHLWSIRLNTFKASKGAVIPKHHCRLLFCFVPF